MLLQFDPSVRIKMCIGKYCLFGKCALRNYCSVSVSFCNLCEYRIGISDSNVGYLSVYWFLCKPLWMPYRKYVSDSGNGGTFHMEISTDRQKWRTWGSTILLLVVCTFGMLIDIMAALNCSICKDYDCVSGVRSMIDGF